MRCDRHLPSRTVAFLAFALLFATAHLTWFPNLAAAQSQQAKEEEERKAKQRAEAVDALATLSNLLISRNEQREGIENLKHELKKVKEPALEKEIAEKIKAETGKLEQTEAQISALTTGVTAEEIKGDQNEKFELQSELESLVQPFVKMMKDATENARQIENLKRTLATAEKQQRLAERAIVRLALLNRVEAENDKNADSPTRKHLTSLLGRLAQAPAGGQGSAGNRGAAAFRAHGRGRPVVRWPWHLRDAVLPQSWPQPSARDHGLSAAYSWSWA